MTRFRGSLKWTDFRISDSAFGLELVLLEYLLFADRARAKLFSLKYHVATTTTPRFSPSKISRT